MHIHAIPPKKSFNYHFEAFCRAITPTQKNDKHRILASIKLRRSINQLFLINLTGGAIYIEIVLTL
jgi:hypothetical protein